MATAWRQCSALGSLAALASSARLCSRRLERTEHFAPVAATLTVGLRMVLYVAACRWPPPLALPTHDPATKSSANTVLDIIDKRQERRQYELKTLLKLAGSPLHSCLASSSSLSVDWCTVHVYIIYYLHRRVLHISVLR
jgi:hypothetical protein